MTLPLLDLCAIRPPVTHALECCCTFCETVKTNRVDVEAWKAFHDPHGPFARMRFPHQRPDWHWLICEGCGARVLVGTHPMQAKQKRKKTC